MPNQRTATKATIKRASAVARRDIGKLDRTMAAELRQTYQQARTEIEDAIRSYGDAEGSIRLESLRDIRADIDNRLAYLTQVRDGLLNQNLNTAAAHGTKPFESLYVSGSLNQISHDAVSFVHNFKAADGLQLSDRLWRIDYGAKERIGQALESAIIQGSSASKAAQDFLMKGEAVPADILRKMKMANAHKLAKISGLSIMKGEGNPYANALRLFRTEINRAHGEAFMATGESVEDFGGWRFMLSPNHPEPDICDMHSRANVYGLGAGVYPSREKCPWPAHPGTISFTEIVFKDEITDEDRAGKTTHIDWLRGQKQSVQEGALGSRKKAVALRKDILKKGEINTPWRVLKEKYTKRGIDVDAFNVKREKVPKLGSTIMGIDPDEFATYSHDAFKHAPAAIKSVAKQVGPPKQLTVIQSGTSYFMGDGIVLSRTSMVKKRGNYSEHDVYRHEYGHYLDFWAMTKGSRPQPISSLPATSGGLKDVIDHTKRSLYAKTAAQKERRIRLRSEIIGRDDLDLADLFGALTKNKVGYGHSVQYLSRPGFAETEVFANLTDIYSRKDQGAWRYAQAELPELTQAFDELMKRLANEP